MGGMWSGARGVRLNGHRAAPLPRGYVNRGGAAAEVSRKARIKALAEEPAGDTSRAAEALRARGGAAAARPWRLHHGDEIADAHIAFRLVGPEEAPVVAVLGGISAHRVV